MAHLVTGDLFEATEDILVHQCNCVTVKSHGLSADLSVAFPYADPYVNRRPVRAGVNLAVPDDRATLGSARVFGSASDNQRLVAALFAQYAPGKPGRYYRDHGVRDTAADRFLYFQQSLGALATYMAANGLQSVAFPDHIGCGLAGGNWERDYLPALQEFAEAHPEWRIAIYKRSTDASTEVAPADD
jgi:O-acetyl-ADP-ribose deacetylase (regulator of RNase III)